MKYLLTMNNNITFQNIEFSSWITLYIISEAEIIFVSRSERSYTARSAHISYYCITSLIGEKQQGNGDNCTLSSFMACTIHKIILRQSYLGRWNELGMKQVWGRRERDTAGFFEHFLWPTNKQNLAIVIHDRYFSIRVKKVKTGTTRWQNGWVM